MAQEIADSTLLDTWGSSGAKIEPDISKIIEGWQLGEQPPHEYMNWLQNTFGSKLNHILKNGVTSWNNKTKYLAGATTQHNGNVWLCKTTNTNSAPTDANANWDKIPSLENLALTVDTIDDLPIIATTGDTCIVKDLDRGGVFVYDSTKVSEDNQGTNFNGWIRQFSGAVNVKWFGAKGDGVTDGTTSIQNAIDYAKNTTKEVLIYGDFLVSKILLDNISGFRLTGRGSIIGTSEIAQNSILSLKNVSNIAIDGALFINGNYNTNYEQGVYIHTDGVGQQAAYIEISNLGVVNCKRAYKIGNKNRPDDLVSEINIKGGMTYGCPSVALVVGAQTVVNFIGCTLASLVGSGDSVWQSLPQQTIVSEGATVTINGGELLHVLLSTGGDSTLYNTCCQVQTLASVVSGNIYGSIHVNGALIECAGNLASSANVSSLSNPTMGVIKFVACHGVTTSNKIFIEIDPGFLGDIIVKNNSFFATSPRTAVNIYADSNCNIYSDDVSFGKNFISDLSGIVGGIIHFPHQMVLNVNNLDGQTLTTGVATDLKFIANVNTGNLVRFASLYNSSTGVFTVPAGGLKNIKIETQILKTGLSGELYIQVNGVSYGVRTVGNYSNSSYSINNLNAGDTIKIVLLNLSATTTAGTAPTDWFQIFASN